MIVQRAAARGTYGDVCEEQREGMYGVRHAISSSRMDTLERFSFLPRRLLTPRGPLYDLRSDISKLVLPTGHEERERPAVRVGPCPARSARFFASQPW